MNTSHCPILTLLHSKTSVNIHKLFVFFKVGILVYGNTVVVS